jgi:peptide/nickel transport system substrate-binding protein
MHDSKKIEQLGRWNITRRSMLKGIGFGALTAALAACGAPSQPAATSTESGSAPETNAAPTVAPSTPAKGGILTAASPFDFTIPNPLISASGGSSLLWSRLFKFDSTLTPIPDLAESLEISEDNLTYTVKLRKNALWHDGQPVTADDVVFTMEHILDDSNTFAFAFAFKVKGNPVKVAKVDDHTVTFTVPELYAPFLAHMASGWVMAIAPKHLLDGVDIQTTDFNQKPIGSGPFKVKEMVQGDRLVLSRFDQYYMGEPLLDEIVIRVLTDQEARLAAFQSGDIDIDLREEDMVVTRQFASVEGATAYILETPYVQQFTMNNADPLFSDVRVRKAMSHAIDKANMVRTVIGDEQMTAWQVVGPSHWAHEADVTKYEYDPEKAKQLLEEAGWVDDGSGVRAKDGQKFIFTHYAWRQFEQNYAPIMQQFLKAVGIQMDIQVVPDYPTISELRSNGTSQSLIFGSIDYEPAELFQYFHSSSVPPQAQNVWNYASPEVDKLLEEGQSSLDQEKRTPIYKEVQRRIADDAATIPLHYHLNNEIVRTDRVAGYPEPAANWNGVLYQEPWKIYKIDGK